MKKDTTRRNLILIIIALAITIVILFAIIAFLVFGTSARVRRKITMAESYLEEFDYEQAETAYQDALRIDSKNVEAYLGLIEIYTAQEDYDSALECAKEGYEESRDKRLKKLKEKIKEEMEATKEPEEIEEPEESKKEDIGGIESSESDESENPVIVNAKSKEELSEFLTYIMVLGLSDYTYEDVNCETLIHFAYMYVLINNGILSAELVDDDIVVSGDDVNKILLQYFDITIPLQTTGEIEYKNGDFYFPNLDHPYLYGTSYDVAIIENVKQYNNSYIIEFYGVVVSEEDYDAETCNLKSIEDYYGYSIQDVYNDEFCRVWCKVTCELEEKDGRLIIKKYIRNMDI